MRLLKIGELAARAGITVRALHHYDQIGLLKPSHRSQGGFRLYGREDVARLQRVLALKSLGCDLAETRGLLEGGGSVGAILDRQIEALSAQAEKARALAERLLLLKARLSESGGATTDEWLEILELMGVYEKYLTVAELKALGARRLATSGRLEEKWRDLIGRVAEAARLEQDTASPEASALAGEWAELVRETTGGDRRLAGKLKALFTGEARVRRRKGIKDEAMRWISAAMERRAGAGGEGERKMGGESVVEPKISAYRVALMRAFHQTEERPPIFVDPLALRIIGEKGRAELSDSPDKFRDRLSLGLRVSLAIRARLAEEEFEAARARGVAQLVILGAGLDTYPCRRPPVGAERIFEVDLPDTQGMKRALLAAEGIAEPPGIVYAAADFERQTLREALSAVGFDFGAPAFFSWLGVAMYLEEAAVFDTLALIGALPRGSGVVFDYPVDHALLTERERGAALHLMGKLAERGEPWKCAFAPGRLAEELNRRGFSEVADFGPDELYSRYLSGREDGLRKSGVTRIARALV